MDLKEVEGIDPHRHWYYRHKLLAITRMLSTAPFASHRLIDVGAGSGFFAREVAKTFHIQHTECIDSEYTEEQLGVREGITFLRSPSGHPADVYLFMDVLEHVDDDRLLLRRFVEEANHGAVFAITVPAFMFLWSPHDEFLEHRRRYTLSQLVRVCRESGLSILEARYIYAPTFPLVWAVRRFNRGSEAKSDLKQPNRLASWLLERLSRMEFMFRANSWFGSSVVLLAVKA